MTWAPGPRRAYTAEVDEHIDRREDASRVLSPRSRWPRTGPRARSPGWVEQRGWTRASAREGSRDSHQSHIDNRLPPAVWIGTSADATTFAECCQMVIREPIAERGKRSCMAGFSALEGNPVPSLAGRRCPLGLEPMGIAAGPLVGTGRPGLPPAAKPVTLRRAESRAFGNPARTVWLNHHAFSRPPTCHRPGS
jgi:hypothetical protein